MAAAETSRIFAEALEKGLSLTSDNVKIHVQRSSHKKPSLDGKVLSGGLLDQDEFERSLGSNP